MAGTDVRDVRRGVLTGGLALVFSQAAFGIVFGLAARVAGLSVAEALGMSLFVYSGASQLAAVGLVAQGVAWPGIVVLTALLGARHLLYSASMAPWFAGVPLRIRAVAAHPLTDELFALTMPAFRSLGHLNLRSYAIAAALTLPTWVIATGVGYLGGELLPDPRALALDIVFPAAMGALAVALITDRRAVIAAVVGGSVALALALLLQPSVGIVAGGLVGPLVAMSVPRRDGADVTGDAGTPSLVA